MAKGFFAEATNARFMPVQAIEVSRVRTVGPKSKGRNAPILLPANPGT